MSFIMCPLDGAAIDQAYPLALKVKRVDSMPNSQTSEQFRCGAHVLEAKDDTAVIGENEIQAFPFDAGWAQASLRSSADGIGVLLRWRPNSPHNTSKYID
ncbi:hypothetical protein RWK44_11030 [Rhizobium sp. 25PS6]|uniref:hypothetical protein n=1 Tax=Rhizobium sp. 25PS6 TaxID=3075622 RepID=UPI0028FD8BF4|nr:hypothetical protein [Rhizobium sp. 25PS6]MDU0360939.1 hypothetical protein [Rhizobium sp. 25PS6]